MAGHSRRPARPCRRVGAEQWMDDRKLKVQAAKYQVGERETDLGPVKE